MNPLLQFLGVMFLCLWSYLVYQAGRKKGCKDLYIEEILQNIEKRKEE